MPTTPETMKGMVAVSGAKGVKILGYLTWFSIPDEAVSLRRLKQQLAVHGLPPSLAPKDTKGIDTFKRAMREQEGRKQTNGHVVETTVAQVVETSDDCVYQVSTLVRDLDEKVVEYPKAMRVIFDKRSEELRFNPLGGLKRSDAFDLIQAIQAFYDKNATKVSGARVRNVVRHFLRDEPDEQRGLEGLSGENLRGKSGGIYFVPAKHGDALTALSDMLNELYEGRSYLHAVPLADGASEREIIRRHHIANTRQEMKEAMSECKALLSSDRDRAPRSDVVSNQWARFRAVERRASTYAKLLNDEQEEISDMAEVLRKQLNRLI